VPLVSILKDSTSEQKLKKVAGDIILLFQQQVAAPEQ